MKYVLMTTHPSWRMGFIRRLRSAIPDLIEINGGLATDTYIKSLRELGMEAGMILEDDCIIPDRFMERVDAEIAKRPDDIINFFSRRSDDLTIGERYINGGSYSYNVCTYFPKHICTSIADFIEAKYLVGSLDSSDTDIGFQQWMKLNKRRYWQVVPNTVDHAKGPSSIDTSRQWDRSSKTFKYLDKDESEWLQK